MLYKNLFLSIAIVLSSSNASYCAPIHAQYHEKQKFQGKKTAIALITLGFLGLGTIAFIKLGYPFCKKSINVSSYNSGSRPSIEELPKETNEDLVHRSQQTQSEQESRLKLVSLTDHEHNTVFNNPSVGECKESNENFRHNIQQKENEIFQPKIAPSEERLGYALQNIQEQRRQQAIIVQQGMAELKKDREKLKEETKASLNKMHDTITQDITNLTQKLNDESNPDMRELIQWSIDRLHTLEQNQIAQAKQAFGIARDIGSKYAV